MTAFLSCLYLIDATDLPDWADEEACHDTVETGVVNETNAGAETHYPSSTVRKQYVAGTRDNPFEAEIRSFGLSNRSQWFCSNGLVISDCGAFRDNKRDQSQRATDRFPFVQVAASLGYLH